MDRRNFLRTMIGGVAAGAAVRTFPFRVYSFPTEPIVCFPSMGYEPEVLHMMSWQRYPPLLTPGLRHIFVNWESLKSLAPEAEDSKDGIEFYYELGGLTP